MLSRLAEAFYWIGRYLERAEATARLLAEHYMLTVEDRSVADGRRGVGRARGAVDPARRRHLAGHASCARWWATSRQPVDRHRVPAPRARTPVRARGAPGDVSSRWRSSHLVARPRDGGEPRRPRCTASSSACSRVNGAVEWTMTRDDGHSFLRLGRSLERIDMTARLLDVRHDLVWPDTGATAMLRSAAALSSFLRTGEAPPATAPAVPRARPRLPARCCTAAPSPRTSVRTGCSAAGGVDDGELLLRRWAPSNGRGWSSPAARRPDVVDRLVFDAQMSASPGRRRPRLVPPARHRRVEPLDGGRRLRITHRTGYRYAARRSPRSTRCG